MAGRKPTWAVAALERQGRVTLVALGDSAAGRVRVVTEESKAFRYPEDRLLWRARVLTVTGSTSKEVGRAVRLLRNRAGEAPDWESLHPLCDPGVSLDPADLAGADGTEAGDERALGFVLAAGDGRPWFRVDRGLLVAATLEEVEEEREQLERERRKQASEEALVALLKGHAAERTALDEALGDLLAWGLGPPSDRPPLARRLGFEDPDDALERLDAAGLLPADAVAPVSRRSLPVAFSAQVLTAVEEALLAPDAASSRENLTSLYTIAIDDDSTVEVDDAVSLRTGPGGEPILQVHVADAAAVIAAGSVLDREAMERVTTAYVPGFRIPMLPPRLNDARLSLCEGEARAAVTLEVCPGPGGAPQFLNLFRSTIRIDRRMNYAETAEVSGLPRALRPLVDLARALREGRVAAGARILELPSPDLVVREGRPVFRVRGGPLCGDILVAEAMVAMNRAAAERLRDAGSPCLWRMQDPPKGDLPPEEDPLFALKARRLFSPARLSTEPGPHAGIGASCYLQVTSPIRRWSDLLHQRQLVAVLEGRPPDHGEEEVRALAMDLHRRDREVRTAEREREDYWWARLLEERRGTVEEAVCSRPPHRGRGFAWFPAYLREMVVRWAPGQPAAAEGDLLRLRPGRLAPHRGRVEWELAPPA